MHHDTIKHQLRSRSHLSFKLCRQNLIPACSTSHTCWNSTDPIELCLCLCVSYATCTVTYCTSPVRASTFILCASDAARTRFWPWRSTVVLDDLCRGSVLCGAEWLPFVDCVSASRCGQCINEVYLPVSHCSHAQRWCQSQGCAHTIKATFLQVIPAIFSLLNENEQWLQHVALHVSKAFFFLFFKSCSTCT